MIWKDFSCRGDTVLNWCERKYFGQEKFRAMSCKITKKANYHLMLLITQCLDILTCDDIDKKVFPDIPIIGFIKQ